MGRLALTLPLLATLLLAGCSSSTPEATPQQVKSFDGGPMPAGTEQRIQEAMAKGRAEAAAQREKAAPTQPGG